MATKKTPSVAMTKEDAPKTLKKHIFYGLNLDEKQEALRDALWDEEKRIVFVNAKSGTGKMLLSVAVGLLLVRYGFYDGVLYIAAPHGYEKTGFLPGDITAKSEVFYEPLYQALISCNEDPFRVVASESMTNQKTGSGIVTAITHTFLRGSNLENKFIIVDEAQNQTENDLRKTLTRVCPNSKVVVIGHTGQIDLANAKASGFEKCMRHFMNKEDPRVSVCALDKNYRSWVSQVADESWEEEQ